MSDRVWLASYPKSGSTWLRMLIGCLSWPEGKPLDINTALSHGGLASDRMAFDNVLMIDSGLLTLDEIDCLRPRLYEELRRMDEFDDEPGAPPAAFVKVHDAYTQSPLGEPLLAGAGGARGAILMVRDPRDIAASLANHARSSIDEAIDFMNDEKSAFCRVTDRQPVQLRQQLSGWSRHYASWIGQRDIPVHLLRYEDLKRDTAGTLRAAMGFAGWAVAQGAAERAAALADFARLQSAERKTGFVEWRTHEASGRLFFRRGEAGAWTDELTPQQAARIEASHGPTMERLGYRLTTMSRQEGSGG